MSRTDITSQGFFQELRDKLPFGKNKEAEQARNSARAEIRESIKSIKADILEREKAIKGIEASVVRLKIDVIHFKRQLKALSLKKDAESAKEKTKLEQEMKKTNELLAKDNEKLKQDRIQLKEIKEQLKLEEQSLKEVNDATASGRMGRIGEEASDEDQREYMEELFMQALNQKEVAIDEEDRELLFRKLNLLHDYSESYFPNVVITIEDAINLKKYSRSTFDAFWDSSNMIGECLPTPDTLSEVKAFKFVTKILYDQIK